MDSLATEVYRPVDWLLTVEGSIVGNPFDVGLRAVAAGPGGAGLELPGFYKGPGRWCVRFAPPAEGTWRLRSLSSHAALAGRQVDVSAGPNTNAKVHGPLRVDPGRPLHFRWDDGEPYFLMGYEIDWLWALDQTAEGTPRLESLLDAIAAAGFNHVMVNSYAYDCPWQKGRTRANDFGPPELLAWPGEHGRHDYTRLNTAYFDHYDRMMWALYERGMVAHVYLKVYNKMVPWPAPRSREEDLFMDHFVARYQAFGNLVWDFSKECYYEADKDYVADRLRRVAALDAYGHLRTVHDDKYFAFNEPYRRCVEFVTDQNHSEFYPTILDQRRRAPGPVVNAEYGYEHGPGGIDDCTYRVVQPPLEVLCRTWDVVTAGGYPVYYYTNHAWDVVEWEEMPAGLGCYRHLYDLMTSTSWQEMEPRPDLGQSGLRCLTDGRDEMVLFARDGRGCLTAPREWGGWTWRGSWMDIQTGERRPMAIESMRAGARHHMGETFGGQPAAAHLRRV